MDGRVHFGANNSTLVVSVGHFHCAKFSVAKRLLPLDVIRQTVAERMAEQEAQQGIPISKREQKRMIEEVHFELLPKAFVQKIMHGDVGLGQKANVCEPNSTGTAGSSDRILSVLYARLGFKSL